jgi:hypothetical protein
MKPFRLYPSDVTQKVTASKLDIICLIEGGEAVPILFETLKGLLDWSQTNRLKVLPLYEGTDQGPLRISGWYPLRPMRARVWIDQVWTHAKWRKYRGAMVKRSEALGIRQGLPNSHDADHVVARSRLRNTPHAWTLLFEVPKQPNRVFGAQVERKLKPFCPGFYQYNLTGLELFKLYGEAMPSKNVSTLDEAIERVRGQFLPHNEHANKFLDQMEREVRYFYESKKPQDLTSN